MEPARMTAETPDMRKDYLDLLEKALIGLIYQDPPLKVESVGHKPLWKRLRRKLFGKRKGKLEPFKPERRAAGNDWPTYAHSMIGVARIKNLRMICEEVIKQNIPGDFIETGIWRGGSCIYARAIFNAYGATDRTVWCADSFEGLPAPDVNHYPLDKTSDLHHFQELAVSLEQVQENFRRYGLLSDNVKFLKGWFKDTLPTAPIEKLAILRLDGDMYESTMDGLKVYDKVSPGGYIIVDDYGVIPACAQAITDFRAARGITDKIIKIDDAGIYWKKMK